MSWQVTVKPRAERALADAFDWYEKQVPGLGGDFLKCGEAAIQVIAENPFIYPLGYRQTRCALVKRFPYGVFYSLEEERIVVLTVRHLARNPKTLGRELK